MAKKKPYENKISVKRRKNTQKKKQFLKLKRKHINKKHQLFIVKKTLIIENNVKRIQISKHKRQPFRIPLPYPNVRHLPDCHYPFPVYCHQILQNMQPFSRCY